MNAKISKVLIVFRGENIRHKWGYVSALNCVDNWNKSIYDDLRANNIQYDTVLFTYPTEIVDELKNRLNVKQVVYTEHNQQTNMKEACKYMQEHQHEYDRFIIMRFDFQYKLKVTQWKTWNDEGIHIVNKDVHWPTSKLYADIVFVVDKQYLDLFCEAVAASKIHLHQVGTYVYELDCSNNTNIMKLMYKNYHHMTTNPLHSLKTYEADPDVDNYDEKSVVIITDVSPWNR